MAGTSHIGYASVVGDLELRLGVHSNSLLCFFGAVAGYHSCIIVFFIYGGGRLVMFNSLIIIAIDFIIT